MTLGQTTEQAVDEEREKATERREKAKGLRALADLVEEHPEIGDRLTDTNFYIHVADDMGLTAMMEMVVAESAADKLAQIARVLPGRVEKEQDDFYFTLVYPLGGGLAIHAYASRGEVCERKVIRTEEVETEEEVPMEERIREMARGLRERGEVEEAEALERTLLEERKRTKTEEREVVEWECAPILGGRDDG